MIRKGQACWSAVVRGSVCSIALLLVCLDWKSDSFSYRTHLPFDSKHCRIFRVTHNSLKRHQLAGLAPFAAHRRFDQP
jgi:hypothetical protein